MSGKPATITLADWMIGTALAWLPIRERIAHCRAMLSQPAAPRRP